MAVDDDARRAWVEQAAQSLRQRGWSVTGNVYEWLEQYYEERSPVLTRQELDEDESGDILRRLLDRFRAKSPLG